MVSGSRNVLQSAILLAYPTVSHRYSGWLGQFVINEVMQELEQIGIREISNKNKGYRL